MKRLPYWASDAIKCFLIVAVGLLVIWLLFSVGSLFGPDKGSWQKVNIDWDYGSIEAGFDENSNPIVDYVSGFDSLYTKDLIECTGYEITVSFPAGVTLEVHYFDADDVYIGTKTIAEERFVSLKPGDDEIPEAAAGIRLCLTPDSGEEFELALGLGNVMKKWKYAGYVTLSVTNGDTGAKTPDGI